MRSIATAKIPLFKSKKKTLLGGNNDKAYQPLVGGYHERQGHSTQTVKHTKMGFFPKSKWVWAFSLISLFQACAVLALEGFIFVSFNKAAPDSDTVNDDKKVLTTIPTFFALFIFAFVYQLVLVWDALRMKNTIQIIGLVGLNVGLFIYAGVQIAQYRETSDILKGLTSMNTDTWLRVEPVLITIPCILGVTTIMLGFVSYKLYNEFAWTIYKHISADLRMKRRYLLYQIYVSLLKFDLFFAVGFTIQFVVIVGGRGDAERIATACAIPATFVIMFAAFFFVRREILSGTIAVISLYFGGLAYFVFKFYRIYDKSNKERYDKYQPAKKELSTFAILTILLMICTIIVACMCAHNYGRGLKPYIMHSNTKAVVGPDDRPAFDEIHGQPSAYGPPSSYPLQNESYASKPGAGRPNAARMEID